MPNARFTLGGGTIAQVTQLANTIPPDQQPVPNPTPGGTVTFAYTGAPLRAIGARTWCGGYPHNGNPGGGITVIPQPSLGVMTVMAWWPNCTNPIVMRTHQDGSVHPVRGAYPLNVSAPTVTNYATNPSIETGLNGYVANTGNPTLTQVTRADMPTSRNHAIRATLTTGTTNQVTVPQSIPVTGNAPFTVALDLRVPALPTGGVAVDVAYLDGAGGTISTVTTSLSGDVLLPSVNQFGRIGFVCTPPLGAASIATVKFSAIGEVALSWMELDEILIVPGSMPLQAYYDGSVLGGVWNGTLDLSTSSLAPVVTFNDGECPLDQYVTYTVANFAPTGGTASTPGTELLSNNQTWVTNPNDPGNPRLVLFKEAAFAIVHAAQQGVFLPLGRSKASVITGGVRGPGTGTMTWGVMGASDYSDGFAVRDDWRDHVLHDQSALCFRMPKAFGYGDAMWVNLGDTTEDPEGRGPNQPTRVYSAPFTEVDAPEIVTF